MLKILEDKRRYLFAVYVGNAKGTLRRILEWYWSRELENMSEGEVLKRYYEVTRKETGYAIGFGKGSERYIDE